MASSALVHDNTHHIIHDFLTATKFYGVELTFHFLLTNPLLRAAVKYNFTGKYILVSVLAIFTALFFACDGFS